MSLCYETEVRKSTQPVAACPHRPPCPGCPRFGAGGITADAHRTVTALAQTMGIDAAPVVEGSPFGYRYRARLAVRGRATSPKIGIFQEQTHRIADIPRCPIHHPRVNDVAAALRRALRATGTPPYVDRTHRGLVRYLQVVIERRSGQAQVVVVGNGDDPTPLRPLLTAFADALGDRLHSLWWNGQPARTNAILGPHWAKLHGPDAVIERIGGADVFFPPGAFGQANLDLAERIVAHVHGWVPDDACVVEFHAGCGAIGLGLAQRARHVTFNEVAPAALDGLALGLAGLPATIRTRTTVLAGEASRHVAAIAEADVVIADPPRKGLEPVLLDALCAQPPHRVILVSCSLPAFVREATRLQASGLRARAIAPYALFPHTAHVETVALFERATTRQ
jgi:tRNA/tmRNA/rRNA uracil-C5-methylase (TrmA/RlmC/RlmD family)